MENNLPFFQVSIIDKIYNDFVLKFLKKLDDGNVFKSIFYVLLNLLGYAILIGGVILTFIFLFGKSGFIMNTMGSKGADAWLVISSIIGMLVGVVVSIILVWFLYSIIRKRTNELNQENFDGLLDFVFIKLNAKLIIIFGELLFAVLLTMSVLQIFAALIGGPVYFSLGVISNIILFMIPIGDLGYMISDIALSGNYSSFVATLTPGLIGFVVSFIVLVFAYVWKEVYLYMIKLVKVLISFLPKFAIPLAIRTKNEQK